MVWSIQGVGRWGTRVLPCKTPRRADQCLPHNAVGHRGYKEMDCHVGNLSRGRTLGGRIGGGGLGPRFLTRRMGSMDVLG